MAIGGPNYQCAAVKCRKNLDTINGARIHMSRHHPTDFPEDKVPDLEEYYSEEDG